MTSINFHRIRALRYRLVLGNTPALAEYQFVVFVLFGASVLVTAMGV